MLTPPEELDGPPVKPDADPLPEYRYTERDAGAWTRPAAGATAATTVALAPRGWVWPAAGAAILSLLVLALSAAVTAWFFLF